MCEVESVALEHKKTKDQKAVYVQLSLVLHFPVFSVSDSGCSCEQ